MNDASAVVQTRVPARRLRRAEKILERLGLTPGEAVNLLLAQIEIRQGLPFEVSVHPKPVLTSDEQADEWTRAFGEY